MLFAALLFAACPGDDDDSGSDYAAVNDDDASSDDDDAVDDDDADEAGPPALEDLNTALRDNEAVQACFQTARDEGVVLEDLISLNLVVEPDGSVSSARITTPSHADTDLDTCISSIAVSLIFDPWVGDAVTLNYQFFPNAG